ncbi:MAG TPA: hypothetical protein VHD85_01645 [Terracidiphilus sp.]|jgi:hypothetical protein|nr:hypothetical protein [Terracidiphilus sp.]
MKKYIAFFTIGVMGLFAQDTPKPRPIDLSFTVEPSANVPSGMPNVPQIRLTLRNNSPLEALAYVVVVGSVDQDGKKGPTRVTQYTKHALFDDQTPFQAGGVFQKTVSGFVDKAGRPLKAEPALDYVLFADGSEWGPDTLKQSREVKAILRGANTAALSLNKLLESQGAAAVERRIREAAKSCPGCGTTKGK